MDESDALRTATDALSPDARSLWLSVRSGPNVGRFDLQRRCEALSNYGLHDNVPEEIRIQYETSRNLFLYAWFVYRFHTVAETHALSTLEFALRLRVGDQFRQNFPKRLATLSSLLQFACDTAILTNDKIESRFRATLKKSTNPPSRALMEV